MITKGNCYPAFSFKDLEDFRLCILDLKNEINDLKKKVTRLELERKYDTFTEEQRSDKSITKSSLETEHSGLEDP